VNLLTRILFLHQIYKLGFPIIQKKKKKKKKKTHTKLIIKTLRYLMGIVYWGITFIKEKDFKFYTDADYNIPMYNWWNLHIFLL